MLKVILINTGEKKRKQVTANVAKTVVVGYTQQTLLRPYLMLPTVSYTFQTLCYFSPTNTKRILKCPHQVPDFVFG